MISCADKKIQINPSQRTECPISKEIFQKKIPKNNGPDPRGKGVRISEDPGHTRGFRGYGTWETRHDILSDTDHLSSGIRTSYPLGFGPLILWDPDHLSSGIRTTYPLGYGPLILWDTDLLSSGIRTSYPLGYGPLILWDTNHLSSWIRTTYPLVFVLWDLAIRGLRYNHRQIDL